MGTVTVSSTAKAVCMWNTANTQPLGFGNILVSTQQSINDVQSQRVFIVCSVVLCATAIGTAVDY